MSPSLHSREVTQTCLITGAQSTKFMQQLWPEGWLRGLSKNEPHPHKPSLPPNTYRVCYSKPHLTEIRNNLAGLSVIPSPILIPGLRTHTLLEALQGLSPLPQKNPKTCVIASWQPLLPSVTEVCLKQNGLTLRISLPNGPPSLLKMKWLDWEGKLLAQIFKICRRYRKIPT